MKKIIGIVIASLMFANIGFAEMRLIEDATVRGKYIGTYVSTLCVDGYKFVLSISTKNGRSFVQFFEERDGKSLPAKC